MFAYADQAPASASEDPSRFSAQTDRVVVLPAREGPIGALRFFAWLDLVGGIIGAVLIWSTFGSIDIPNAYGSYASREANLIGIVLGGVVLAQGVFLCALFLVIAGAAEDISAMREHQAVSAL